MDALLNSSHPLIFAYHEGDPKLSAILQTLETYVSLISSRLSYPIAPDETEFSQFATESAGEISLLGFINTESSVAILEELYYKAASDLDSLEILLQNEIKLGASPERLLSIANQEAAAKTIHNNVLRSFELLNDETVIYDVYSRLDQVDGSIQATLFNYIKSVSSEQLDKVMVVLDETWNMIGLPLEPSASRHFDDVFYTATLSIEPYEWNGTSYVLDDTLDLGKAYWVSPDITGSGQHIIGVPIGSITIQLGEGWNMFSPPNCTPNDFHRLQMLDENNMAFFDNPIFGYDENGYYSVDLDFMSAGEGYWIQLESDATVTMDCSLAIGSKRGYTPPSIPDSFGILSIQDAAGGNQQLYFGGTLPNDFQANFSMPPRPFEGSFDARLAGDTRLTEEDTARIRIQARQYPLTIELANLPGGSSSTFVLEELIAGQIVATRSIEQGTPLQITNEQVSTLRVRPE